MSIKYDRDKNKLFQNPFLWLPEPSPEEMAKMLGGEIITIHPGAAEEAINVFEEILKHGEFSQEQKEDTMNNRNRCFGCGCMFHPTRADQLYCTKKCRLEHNKVGGPLILPIKKQWFDMILSGEKKEEYRERKPYWETRFKKYFGWAYGPTSANTWGWQFTPRKKEVIFRNGYGKNAPEFTAEVTICEKTGNPDWGAVPGEVYYALKICEITKKKNC